MADHSNNNGPNVNFHEKRIALQNKRFSLIGHASLTLNRKKLPGLQNGGGSAISRGLWLIDCNTDEEELKLLQGKRPLEWHCATTPLLDFNRLFLSFWDSGQLHGRHFILSSSSSRHRIYVISTLSAFRSSKDAPNTVVL
jgi:hypothetical protein